MPSTPRTMFLPQCDRPSFPPIQNNRQHHSSVLSESHHTADTRQDHMVLLQAVSTPVNLATFPKDTSVRLCCQAVHKSSVTIQGFGTLRYVTLCRVINIHRRFRRQYHLRNDSNCVLTLPVSQDSNSRNMAPAVTSLNQSHHLLMQGPSWQADSCLTSEVIPLVLQESKCSLPSL